MERPRYLSEVIDAMREDAEIGDWLERFTKQMFVGGQDGEAERELIEKIRARYQHYFDTPVEVEREKYWPESETA